MQKKNKNNTGLKLIFAINYGGRAEIVQSMKSIYDELQRNGQDSKDIDESMINKHLMTHSYPDPELLIRTSVNNVLVISLFGSLLIVNLYSMRNCGQTLTVKNLKLLKNISISPKTLWRVK